MGRRSLVAAGELWLWCTNARSVTQLLGPLLCMAAFAVCCICKCSTLLQICSAASKTLTLPTVSRGHLQCTTFLASLDTLLYFMYIEVHSPVSRKQSSTFQTSPKGGGMGHATEHPAVQAHHAERPKGSGTAARRIHSKQFRKHRVPAV